jgi:tetratricopeptide (TPR) repeat protein
MTNPDIIELEGQPDVDVAGKEAASRNDELGAQELWLAGLLELDDTLGPDIANDAAPRRRRPDFRRLKDALRTQPPELAGRWGEPFDEPGDPARGRLCQRMNRPATRILWQAAALVCGLSLALSLLVFIADLVTALTPRIDERQATPDRAERTSEAAQPAPISRAPLSPPRKTITHLAPQFGGEGNPPAAPADANSPSESLSVSSRRGLSATLPAVARVSQEMQGGLDLDEGRPAHPFGVGDRAAKLPRQPARADEKATTEDLLQRLMEQASTPSAAYELGYLLQQQERYAEAVTSYQRAVQLAPDRAYVLYDLGSVLAKLGRFDEAAASFERAAALDRSNPFILYDWGWALERAGALGLATDRYREALAAGAESVAGNNARARLDALGWPLRSSY